MTCKSNRPHRWSCLSLERGESNLCRPVYFEGVWRGWGLCGSLVIAVTDSDTLKCSAPIHPATRNSLGMGTTPVWDEDPVSQPWAVVTGAGESTCLQPLHLSECQDFCGSCWKRTCGSEGPESSSEMVAASNPSLWVKHLQVCRANKLEVRQDSGTVKFTKKSGFNPKIPTMPEGGLTPGLFGYMS